MKSALRMVAVPGPYSFCCMDAPKPPCRAPRRWGRTYKDRITPVYWLRLRLSIAHAKKE